MANFSIQVDDQEVVVVVRSLLGRLDNAQPLYKSWANHLEKRTVQSFQRESSPTGIAWAQLSPKTLTKRAKRKSPRTKGKILRDTGSLYDSVAARTLPDGAEVGTNRQVGAYSLGAIHQFGAPARNIPARPFLPMDPAGELLAEDVTEIRELTQRWLDLQ